MTLEEFLDWYPDGCGRYELWNGVAIEMQPTGSHEQVGGFLGVKLGVEIERLALPYLNTQGKLVRVVIEVVSTNWRGDYGHKFIDYEALQIPEYWVVDYLGLGGKRYIGTPKQPTFSVYQLLDGEYQAQQFRGSNRIVPSAFPELKLTAEQVFAAGL